MRLLLDSSAARNLAEQDTVPLSSALIQGDYAIFVPATVRFELRRRALKRLAGTGIGALTGPEPDLLWLASAWSQGLSGGLLDFSDGDAIHLADWVSAPALGSEWFEVEKLRKVWEDSRGLRNRAIDQAWLEQRWEVKGPAGCPALKDGVHRAATNLLAATPPRARDYGHVSATLDWLHLGIAVRHGLMLLSDDRGIEYPPQLRVESRDLFTALGLPWR